MQIVVAERPSLCVQRVITEKRDLCLGLALATPFLADLVPWRITGLFAIPWVLTFILQRWSVVTFRWPSPIEVAIAILIAAHYSALILTTSPFQASLWKETLVATALLGMAVVSNPKNPLKVAKGFFAAVVTIGALTAIVGLIKLGLQDRGYLLRFIIDACPGQYPQGTNLCTDYNVMGITWLVAGVGLISWHLRTGSLLALLILPIVLAAGFSVGSRRFLLFAAYLPLMWLVLALWSSGWRAFTREMAALVIVAMGTWALISTISSPQSFERFRFGAEEMTVIEIRLPNLFGFPTDDDAVRPPNRANPDVIAGTIDMEGLSSRSVRWKLGVELLAERPIAGRGMTYQKIFSDQFSQGKIWDYPHLPVLSEGLIGGVPLLLVALGIYIGCALLILRAPLALHLTGAGSAFLLSTGVAGFSGDTLFSIPQWLATALVLVLSVGVRPRSKPQWLRPAHTRSAGS